MQSLGWDRCKQETSIEASRAHRCGTETRLGKGPVSSASLGIAMPRIPFTGGQQWRVGNGSWRYYLMLSRRGARGADLFVAAVARAGSSPGASSAHIYQSGFCQQHCLCPLSGRKVAAFGDKKRRGVTPDTGRH